MNYLRIHDKLIERARCREYIKGIHHLHHILPEHEDPTSTEMVPVTVKEHALLHYLRWKLAKTNGNYGAYKLLRAWYRETLDAKEFRRLRAVLGGKEVWSQGKGSGICSVEWRKENPEKASENSSKGGKVGGKTTGSMLWWNNGISNVRSFHQPEGFIRGQLMSEKKLKSVLENNTKMRAKNKSTRTVLESNWTNGIENAKYTEDPKLDGWFKGKTFKNGKVKVTKQRNKS